MSLDRYISELKDGTASRKVTIIKIIATSDDQSVIDILVGCLKDYSPTVRIAAIQALEKKDYFEEAVLLNLCSDSSRLIRKQVLKMLSNFPKVEYLSRIQNLLIDSDESVRLEVVNLLHKIGKESLPLLHRALKDDSPLIQQKARNYLKELEGYTEPVEEIISEGLEPVDNFVEAPRFVHLEKSAPTPREPALSYKEKLKKIEQTVEDTTADSIKPLLKALEDKSWTVREFAIKKISEMNEIDSVEIKKLLVHPIWYVKAAAIRILGLRKEESALDLIIPIMKDSNVEVRRAVAEALGQLRKSDVIIPLQFLLQDKNVMVRKEAEKSLILLKAHNPHQSTKP